MREILYNLHYLQGPPHGAGVVVGDADSVVDVGERPGGGLVVVVVCCGGPLILVYCGGVLMVCYGGIMECCGDAVHDMVAECGELVLSERLVDDEVQVHGTVLW